jgi:hypothetical protein
VVTAGPQDVTASATAGPSGVGSISCSVDGAPAQSFPGPSASVSVSGLGAHQVSCTAYNRSYNSSGAPGASPTQTWDLSIRKPSVSTISFGHIADALHCVKRRERVYVPARWTYVHVHHHRVRVRIPAQTRRIKVVHCRRRLLLRRSARHLSRWVAFGHRARVSGWLGTTDGTAIANAPVRIVAAADNGEQHFRTVATAVTNADGAWSAKVPAGPSRLVEAVYAGSPLVEPATSSRAHVLVPARVRLSIRPHTTHWGGRIEISGKLDGGYVPRAGELVVLHIGWHGGATEIGHLYARRNGAFRSPYTFLRGYGRVTYWLWATTAKESDYPFRPAASPRAAVVVGP